MSPYPKYVIFVDKPRGLIGEFTVLSVESLQGLGLGLWIGGSSAIWLELEVSFVGLEKDVLMHPNHC